MLLLLGFFLGVLCVFLLLYEILNMNYLSDLMELV